MTAMQIIYINVEVVFMKKVILGIGMLISGVIGFAGIMVAALANWNFANGWMEALGYYRLTVPFLLFIALAVSGLIVAILATKKDT